MAQDAFSDALPYEKSTIPYKKNITQTGKKEIIKPVRWKWQDLMATGEIDRNITHQWIF